MTFHRLQRLALAALIPAAALTMNFTALAQSPPATPPAAGTPDTPAPVPQPIAPATPATPGASTPPTATPAPPDAAGTVAPPPAAETTPAPAAPATAATDPFGEETVLPAKTVLMLRGSAKWDSAFDTLIEAFKTLTAQLDKQGIKSAGNPLIIYTATDDAGFMFSAAIPVDQEPKNLPKDMSIGKSPEGKALKFVHRGSYDNMDNTYEAITNYLDDKKLEAKDTFIEEYTTNPLTTAEDKLVINVYVPMK